MGGGTAERVWGQQLISLSHLAVPSPPIFLAAAMFRHLLLLLVLPATVLAAATTNGKDANMRFETKTSKLRQELKIVRTSDKAVSFELTITGECQRTVTGEAQIRRGPQTTLRDEKGRSYSAEQFIYLSEGCGLILRIETNDARRATIAQAGACHNACTPLLEVMTRVDAARSPRKKASKSPADR